MIKRFILALAGFAALVVSLGAVKVAQIREMSAMPRDMPAPAVTSIRAETAVWRPTIDAIATLAPVEGVTVAADAEGTVVRIAVDNGAAVQAGQVLIELDTSVETAQLAAAAARQAIARLERDRAAELRVKNSISQAELDAATARVNQADADVAALQALLNKKVIRAPFAGRVGIRSVNVGQYVGRGARLLPLQRLDPMFVDFSIPQRHLPQLAVGQTVQVRVDAYPDRPFTGTLTAIDPGVDPSSRNIAVQATVANPEDLLRAGMFARAAIELPENAPVVVLPATAVSYASYGNSVFVIEKMKDETGQEYLGVRQQFVRLGATRGDQIAILSGVKPGEEVATSGVFKLRNGLRIRVNNRVQPTNNPAPRPNNA
ncbi:MAG: efflux RND transporter periplasmic adaptor subunit [Verrucomicrobia bacterium]|nr:efflux RND transporter periplasmic adaptor subunit [Verrucomicrobiota bacterium]